MIGLKKNLVIYTNTLVQIYNWHSKKLVNKTFEIFAVEKYLISKIENLLNLSK